VRPTTTFDETLSLTEAVGYHSMFSFKYSPRPNTLASKRMPDDVPEAEKTRRIVELQAAAEGDSGHAPRQASVGTHVDVLVDTTEQAPRLGVWPAARPATPW
jgi:tRNA-2-methylthio-N6-dimethylallyladenosine synthase